MIYLDNAATTFPKPNEVYNSVDDCIRNYCANPGRGAHNLSIKCDSKIFDCRERLSMLLNIENHKYNKTKANRKMNNRMENANEIKKGFDSSISINIINWTDSLRK